MTAPVPSAVPTGEAATKGRDNPVTDHQQDWCEHEMSQCNGGCPPYGYCSSDSHIGDVSPDWPCPSALRALGETKAQWIAKHDADLEAWCLFAEQQIQRQEARHV